MQGWMSEVRASVNTRLEGFLSEKYSEAEELSPESLELVASVRDLTMRGGKRLRAGVIAAGVSAADPSRSLHASVDVSASVELLQSYLLIHDDWMDGDEERRGGPSTHAALSKQHNDAHLGAAIAVLAGDLAAAYAWELFLAAPYSSESREKANALYLTIHKEVFFGQHLDLIASDDVARVHRLKTGSYTVRGPLLLGAVFGGADEALLASLTRFADPLGLAFQLRDDILGTFGKSEATGKPAGNDIRAGKMTALIAEAGRRLSPDKLAQLKAVHGRQDTPQADIDRVVGLLEQEGVRASVESALEEKTREAFSALSTIDVADQGRAMLTDVADLLTKRDH